MGLGKEVIIKFKEMFLSEHAKITKISNLRAVEESEHEIGSDEADIVSFIQLKTLTDSLSNREKVVLNKIENSLIKIAQGTFGICEECEEEISAARLKAIPHCDLCISCAEASELHRKK